MLKTRNWEVNRDDVLESETPEPTETHKTISHGYIVETSEKIMEEENLTLKQSKYYMSANRMKYFGKYIFDKKIYDEPPKGIIKMSDSGLDIDHRSYDLNPNVTLGFVNSHDKSLASCVFFGTLMPICSNEGWHNRMWFKRKHTGNIESDLDIGIKSCLINIDKFSQGYAGIMEEYKNIPLNDLNVKSLIIESARKKIIPSSKILAVYKEWNEPSFNYDNNKDSVYKLYNSFTTVLRDYKEHAVTNPKRSFALLELLNEIQ